MKMKIETGEEYQKLMRALDKFNLDINEIGRNLRKEFWPYDMDADPEDVLRHLQSARVELYRLCGEIYSEVGNE